MDQQSIAHGLSMDVVWMSHGENCAKSSCRLGAGVGVGMLRGREIPSNDNGKCLGWLASWFRIFKDSKTFDICWTIYPMLPKIPFMFSGRYGSNIQDVQSTLKRTFRNCRRLSFPCFQKHDFHVFEIPKHLFKNALVFVWDSLRSLGVSTNT